jgi:alpha-beta hydrolase superfamily lysophospholipase
MRKIKLPTVYVCFLCILLSSVLIGLAGCSSNGEFHTDTFRVRAVDAFRSTPSDRAVNREYRQEWRQRYLKQAGLNIPYEHTLEILPFGDIHLAVNQWFPDNDPGSTASTGTVIVLHGYLSHTGHLAYPIEHLVRAGFTVLAADLPGHGLSGGRRGDIDNFSRYAEVLQALIDHADRHDLPEPYHAAGFSTGASTIIEYLRIGRNSEQSRLDRIVLVSPLIRHHGYRSSWAGYHLFRWAVPRIPALNANTDDPLTVDSVPMTWVGAVIRWNRVIAKMEPILREILVLQGLEDEVVQWRYNIPFLRKKLPNAQFILFEDARHELLLRRPVRTAATEIILDHLTR